MRKRDLYMSKLSLRLLGENYWRILRINGDGSIGGTPFPNGGTNLISYAEAHANCSNRDVKMLLDYL